jgi:hypothetical protein
MHPSTQTRTALFTTRPCMLQVQTIGAHTTPVFCWPDAAAAARPHTQTPMHFLHRGCGAELGISTRPSRWPERLQWVWKLIALGLEVGCSGFRNWLQWVWKLIAVGLEVGCSGFGS